MEIGNKNVNTSYGLCCIVCGAKNKVHLIAYRNKNMSINGFLVSCDKCDATLNGKQFGIWDDKGKAII